jgi:hypothetical protein
MTDNNQPPGAEPQETPQSITQPTTTLNTPKFRNFLKVFLITILLFLVFATAGAGYQLFSQQKNSTNPGINKSPQSSPLDNPFIQKVAEKLPIPKITFVPITITPTLTPNQTNPQPNGQQANSLTPPQNQPTTQTSNITPLTQNWNTYNNTSLNFSLTYPSGLTLHENSHGLGVTDISFTSPDNTNAQNAPDYQILIYPKSIGKLIGQDFNELFALTSNSTLRMTSDASAPQQFTKIGNITINGLRAFDYTTTSDPPDPSEEPEIGTYIELGENTIIISTGESNKAILDHMLSTFKSD